MQGLELSKRYYKTYGEPMLKKHFSHLLPYLAVGLAGSGSECLGYDDEISQDHDFEPGFCIFLPDEDVVSSRDAFQLERMYAKLPREFEGHMKRVYNPLEQRNDGVMRIADFMQRRVGHPDGALYTHEWFGMEEQFLLEAINGEIFFDNYGLLTKMRNGLLYLPEDVRRKKLVGNLLAMAQAGQYNYQRCISRQDFGAAQLALVRFVQTTMHAVFLLNKQYMPYYKWQFRALSELPRLAELHDPLVKLISTDNYNALGKMQTIDWIVARVIREVQRQGLSTVDSEYPEPHAYFINETIEDADIRNMHLMTAV